MATAPRPGLVALSVGACALGLYTASLSPDVGPVDSGELTLAAWELGVPHPPGFPLYVLLTHVFASVPMGSVAQSVNFGSAFFMALAVAGLCHLTWQALQTAGVPVAIALQQRGRGRTADMLDDGRDRARAGWVRVGGATTAAALFMSLRTPWGYATVAEVYALTAWLTIAVWQLMLRPSIARMRVAAFLFGLATGTHVASLVAALPALAWYVARTHGLRFFATRELAVFFGLATIGAGVYMYLPLAALQSPVMNWGDPRTPDRFWAHVSGLQYRGEALALSTDGVLSALQRSGAILAGQLGETYLPMALVLVLTGAVQTLRHQRLIFGVLALWGSTNILLTALLNASWAGDRALERLASIDLDAYFLPALTVACVWAGLGAAALLNASSHTASTVAAAALIVVTCVQPVIANWTVNDRSRGAVSRLYADDALASMAPGGLVLLRDWNLSSPLLYVQHVERVRPDIITIDLNLMERDWYQAALARRHVPLFAQVAGELDEFRELGRSWQTDPRSIQRDPSYLAALNHALDRLLLALVEAHVRRSPVYVTFEVMVGEGGRQDSLAATLASRYQLLPQGLVYQLLPDSGFREPAPLALNVAPLLRVVQREAADVLVAQRTLTVYRDMLISRGIYLERHGRCPQALQAFDLALTIDSTSPMAAKIRARCRNQVSSADGRGP